MRKTVALLVPGALMTVAGCQRMPSLPNPLSPAPLKTSRKRLQISTVQHRIEGSCLRSEGRWKISCRGKGRGHFARICGFLRFYRYARKVGQNRGSSVPAGPASGRVRGWLRLVPGRHGNGSDKNGRISPGRRRVVPVDE